MTWILSKDKDILVRSEAIKCFELIGIPSTPPVWNLVAHVDDEIYRINTFYSYSEAQTEIENIIKFV